MLFNNVLCTSGLAKVAVDEMFLTEDYLMIAL